MNAKLDQQYQTILSVVADAAPGELGARLSAAFGLTRRSVETIRKRLAEAGYDMTPVDQFASPGKVVKGSTLDAQYELLMQAAKESTTGNLLRTAARLLGGKSEEYVRTVRKRLEKEGYDMADWHAAARKGTGAGLAALEKPQALATFAPNRRPRAARDHAADYAKIQALLPTVKPGSLMMTMRDAFGFQDLGSVTQLRQALERAGYDMSEWNRVAQTRSRASYEAAEAARAKRAAAAPVPRLVVDVLAPKYTPPLPAECRFDPVPWSIAGIAHVVGVSAEKVLSHARYMCMHVEYGVATTVGDADARRLMAVFGFVPNIAA